MLSTAISSSIHLQSYSSWRPKFSWFDFRMCDRTSEAQSSLEQPGVVENLSFDEKCESRQDDKYEKFINTSTLWITLASYVFEPGIFDRDLPIWVLPWAVTSFNHISWTTTRQTILLGTHTIPYICYRGMAVAEKWW